MNILRSLDRKDWVMVGAGFVALLSVLTMLTVQPARPNPAPLPDDSDQAEITWSEPTVEVILSSGETASRSVSFMTSEELEDVVLEASPEISGFLSMQPAGFEEVEDDESRQVQLLFSIPEGTELGTYEGTIALRELDDDDDDDGDDDDDRENGNEGPNGQILPQTLKVVVHNWSIYSDASSGFEVKYPPTLFVQRLTFRKAGFSRRPLGTEGDEIAPIEIFVIPATFDETLIDVRSKIVQDYSEESVALDDEPSLRITGLLGPDVFGWGDRNHGYLLSFHGGRTYRIQYDLEDEEITLIFEKMIEAFSFSD